MYDAGTQEAVGGSSWQNLIGYPSPSLLTTYTVTGSSVVSGAPYQFIVRVKNAIGYGPWSPVFTIYATTAPG